MKREVRLLTLTGAGGTGKTRLGLKAAETLVDNFPGGVFFVPLAPITDGALVALDDVPVGGAVSATAADGSPVIIAQPTAGEVVGFSAVCTHLGCTVRPDDDRLVCPCHGSEFETLTGRNVAGPAPRPLDPFAVQVVDGQVVGG